MDTKIKKRINQYLQEVERNLDRGAQETISKDNADNGTAWEAEKKDILNELELHIHEELENLSQGQEPTVKDIETVLDTMEAPQEYGRKIQIAGNSNAVRPAPTARIAKLSLYALLSGLIVGIILLIISATTHFFLDTIAFIIAGLGMIIAIIGGFISWREPLGKIAAIAGIVLILISLIFVPVKRSHSRPQNEGNEHFQNPAPTEQKPGPS